MKAQFNGIAPIKSGEEILIKTGRTYGDELVIKEMEERSTGILWRGSWIPSRARIVTSEVHDVKLQVSKVIVDCAENRTTFEVSELK